MEEYRQKRHTALWETYNKRIKRVVLGSVLFALLVLFNVLEPYTERVVQLHQEMSHYLKERQQAATTRDVVLLLQTHLKQLHPVVEKMPWMQSAYDLMRKFREMNHSGSPINMADYQKEANTTIVSVANQVKRDVLKPLAQFYDPPDPLLAKMAPQLVAEFDLLPRAIDGWIAENRDREWFLTRSSKLQQIEILTSRLQNILKDVTTVSQDESEALTKIQFSLFERLGKMALEQKAEEQRLRKKLDTDMTLVIPVWVSGVVSVRQIIYGYPLILLGLTTYLFWMAYRLSDHFVGFAIAEGMKPEDTTDPMMSSVWTFHYRGKIGTIATGCAYAAFVIIMGWCFEKGSDVLFNWIPLDQNPALSAEAFGLVHWLGRLCFMGFLGGLFYWVYHTYSSAMASR